jgi:hypothetical protein
MLFKGHNTGLAVGNTVGIDKGLKVKTADGRADGDRVGTRVGMLVGIAEHLSAAPRPPFEAKPALHVQMNEPCREKLFAGHA